MASGGPADPQSWNRYAYVQGDPLNFNDPGGAVKCEVSSWSGGGHVVCTTAYGKTYDNVMLKSFIQGFDLAAAAEATWGRFFEMRDFQMSMGQRTAAAVISLSAPCQEALGKHWNLYGGSNSLLAKVNQTVFLDASLGYVADLPLTRYNIGGAGVSTFAQLFAAEPDTGAVVSNGLDGRPSNVVITRPGFNNWNPKHRDTILVHEMLHVYTGLSDVDLANTLEIYNLMGRQEFQPREGNLASEAISTYLSLNCPK